jgi:DNA-binding transcriptional ArsR family regulator
MPTVEFHQLLEFFKVLSNESRLKLVGILAQRECSVEELASLLGLKEPTISHHLAKLKALDLLQLRLEGNHHFYRLNATALQTLNKAILSPEQITVLTQDIPTDEWETKVLNTFVEGDRLTAIPASRKKRRVILKWLVQKFAPDQRYPESELNEIIQVHHWDSATLRRELIGYQFMQRENNIYWRLPDSQWKLDDISLAQIG